MLPTRSTSLSPLPLPWLPCTAPHCRHAVNHVALHCPYCAGMLSCDPALPVLCRYAIILTSGCPGLHQELSLLSEEQRIRLWLQPTAVPHQLLLPCCSLLLHPGGSGTTAAALLAGTPQVLCPLHFDQFAWVSLDLNLYLCMRQCISVSQPLPEALTKAEGHNLPPPLPPPPPSLQPPPGYPPPAYPPPSIPACSSSVHVFA